MVLLGICVAALLVGVLTVASQRTQLPHATSYSPQPNGAAGLFQWIDGMGGNPQRLRTAFIRNEQAPTTLLVLQPETRVDPSASSAFDIVAEQGGTLVLAGDSAGSQLYARGLGVRFEAISGSTWTAHSPDNSLTLRTVARYRVRPDGDGEATPLLINSDGDWLALRMPYKQGSLVVFASADPFLNGRLRDESTARFIYREVVSPAGAGPVAFDEVHHSYVPDSIPTNVTHTVGGLLFDTPPGRALMYAAFLGFIYLILSDRRLGPPLPVRPPTETRRTMFEHVQMLANLYRRAGQFSVVRAAFARNVTRQLARGVGSPKRATVLAQALVRIESARSESELIAAVASTSDAS
jgi:hypothetical protein